MFQALSAAAGIIGAVRTLLPEIIALLGDVETAMPNAAIDAKIDMVTTILKSAINGIDVATVDVKAVWPVIEAVITQHTSTAPAAAA